MPFSINRSEGVLIVELQGRIAASDIVDAIQALLAHPEFEPGRSRIWDVRGLTELLLDERDFEAIREMALERRDDFAGRTAIVAVRDIDRMAARLFRAYLKGRSIRTFNSLDQAVAWVRES